MSPKTKKEKNDAFITARHLHKDTMISKKIQYTRTNYTR